MVFLFSENTHWVIGNLFINFIIKVRSLELNIMLRFVRMSWIQCFSDDNIHFSHYSGIYVIKYCHFMYKVAARFLCTIS